MTTSHGIALREGLLARYRSDDSKLPSEWICENTQLRMRPFSFENHEYQIGPCNDPSRVAVFHKCAQLGFTETFFRWTIAFICRHQGGRQAIFTQPTDKDIGTFVKSRADLILEESPIVNKLGTAGVDSVQLKRIGTSFINFRGTFGARAAISVPSDANVYDEVNFSNPRILNQYKSRLQHSDLKLERYISTPTIPNYGVSELFNRSDQKRLFLRCSHCGHQQLITWPEIDKAEAGSIWFKRRIDGVGLLYDKDMMEKFVEKPWDYTPYFGCKKCEREVDRSWRFREWVAAFPERANDLETGVSGWFVSQLDATFMKASDIVKASDRRLEGYRKIEDFYNFCLALTYEGGDNVKITDACKSNALLHMEEMRNSWGTYLGLDLGSICHLVVIKDLYINGFEIPVIIAAIKINKDLLEDEIPKYQTVFGSLYTVSDAQPYTITVEKLASGVPGHMSCCYFGGKKAYSLGADGITVTANRTLTIDAVTEDLPKGRVLLADGLEHLEIVWAHLKRLVKVKAEDDDGTEYYEYVKVGDDHFGLAISYAMLARRIWRETNAANDDHFGGVDISAAECKL